MFFKDTQEVEITATDNSGEDVTIEYLLSDKELSATDLANKNFTAYTGKFTVEPNNEYVIYAKLTDKSGNATYINSNGIVLDNIAPVISGIADGETYCEAQTVTVSDKYGVTVTVNGNPVTPDTNGRFTLSAAEGDRKIVVTDKAGNKTEMTVTVNDGHTGGTATCTDKAVCEVCGTPYGDIKPDNHSGKQHVALKNATATALGNIEYWYCGDCKKYFSDADYKNSIAKESTYLYAVVFDTDNGTDIAAKTTVKWDDKVLDNVTAPTKAGWDFVGWKCNNKDVTDQTTYGELALSRTSAAVELEAQWKSRAANTLILHGNGGITSSSSDVYTSYTGGASIKVSTVPFTKKGYYFNLWNTKADGKGTWYRKGDTVNFTAVHNAEKIELYAIWEANYYTIVFDSNGADGTMKNLSMRYDKSANLTENAFTKDGYEFVSWNTAPDGNATEYTNGQEVLNLTDVSKGTVTLYAQWKDIAAPTGEIELGSNSWKTFLNSITFGLFFKDTQEIEITATDNSGEDVTIEYLLSDKELSEPELANKNFTAYTGKFTVEPNNEYVIYAKLTDNSGNVAYINSNGIVLDNIAPVISGIADGKTYCDAQTVTVSDKYDVTVTMNDEPVTLTNGRFTLSAAEGERKIVVTDKAGNKTEMTVTVNNGHTYEWQSENGKYWQKCKFCGIETAKKDIPEITINGADKVCKTQDYTFTATFFEGAANPKYSYDNGFMGSGDLEFGAIDGVYTATVSSSVTNEVSEFNVTAYGETSDGYIVSATKTVAVQSEHTGGTATCTEKAKCDVCGEEYGEVDSTNHDLENIKGNAATVTETGNIEYWHCADCDKYFADKDGKNEIDLKDTVIGKLPPEIIDGKGQSLTEGEKKALSFRSNAAFSDFIRVEVDGKTLDAKNYTVKEGSTVVTLNADYVKTLSVGEHTLGVVSESGTATTTFTVNAKVKNTATTPATGDNSQTVLWIALLFMSGGALVGTVTYNKKKKRFVK